MRKLTSYLEKNFFIKLLTPKEIQINYERINSIKNNQPKVIIIYKPFLMFILANRQQRRRIPTHVKWKIAESIVRHRELDEATHDQLVLAE